MTFAKYLAALASLVLITADSQAGPPRRYRSYSYPTYGSTQYYQPTGMYPTYHTSNYAPTYPVPSYSSPDSSYFYPSFSYPSFSYPNEYTSPTYTVPTTVTSSEVVPTSSPTSSTPVSTPAASGNDALAEVNATRAQRGLPPFMPDPLLTQGAQAAANARAQRMISGHLPESDFSYLPPGANASAAGCAAWEPSWGWGSCCTYDQYTYAGAAWVMGQDGRRYMHLFVR